MDRALDVLTLILLDPCLTADEAAREAAARSYTTGALAEARSKTDAKRRKTRPAAPTTVDDSPPVGF